MTNVAKKVRKERPLRPLTPKMSKEERQQTGEWNGAYIALANAGEHAQMAKETAQAIPKQFHSPALAEAVDQLASAQARLSAVQEEMKA